MIESLAFKRILTDFFAYATFLGASYIIFATNFVFRYWLIPVTLFAFFNSMARRHREAFNEGVDAASYLSEVELEAEDKNS